MRPRVRNFFKGIKDFLTKESTVSFVRNIAKAAVTMFIIGSALGIVAPATATLLGAELIGESAVAYLTGIKVLQTGIFFGLFGGVQAAVAPIVGKFFEPKQSTVAASYFTETGQAANISQALPSHAPSTAQTVSPTHFQDMLAARDAAAAAMNPAGKAVS
jgi:hypothetical protein